jgi:ribosomal protein S18 acetylase RimI-like enzyme
MAGLLAPLRTTRLAPVTVDTLTPRDVESLRLPGLHDSQTLRQALERYPDRSVWIPATLEYAVLSPWRNRPEIAAVDDLVAIGNAELLLRAAFERCVSRGDELMLAIQLEAPRGPSRYKRAGLELLEEVVTYDMEARVGSLPRRALQLVEIESGDQQALDIIAAIDHAAFPWLWRNSRQEFEVYVRSPGVSLCLLVAAGEPVAYVGATLFPGWGHLDRIAVAPHVQGRGFGSEALSLAVDTMSRRGARRVALSTQRSNVRSQRLYERFGFRRTPEMDYELFGAWCRPGRELRRTPL